MKNLYLCFLATFIIGLSCNAQCVTNGGFENGLGGLAGSYGFTTFAPNLNFSTIDCHIDTGILGYNPVTASTTLNNFTSKVSLVSNASIAPFGVNDPSLFNAGAILPRVNPSGGGNFAIKLNNDDVASRDIVTMNSNFTAASSVISFDFALVFRLHGQEPDIEPFFTARVYNSSGVIININEICYKANGGNDIFNSVSDYLFTGWECGMLQIPEEYIGQAIRLEFVVADCGQGGHVGSVYLDNIRCDASCVPAFGLMTLNPFSISCPKVPFDVCGSFVAPENSTIVPGSLALEIFDQNDNFVSTVTSIPVITGNTFCFSVDPTQLGSIGGDFEFRVNADFTSSSSTYNLFDTSSNEGPDLTFAVVDPQSVTITAGVLQWPDVAENYKLEFVADTTCCPGRNEPNQNKYYSITVTENQLNLYLPLGALQSKCFRWRIKSDCGGWSDWCCLSAAEQYGFPEQFGNPIAPACYNGDLGCLSSLHQTVNVAANTNSYIQRELFITAVNTIFNTASAVYQAGHYIELQPGFNAQAGSFFLAEIEDCAPAETTAPKKKNNYASEERELMQYSTLKKDTGFTVYPNPTDGLMTIISPYGVNTYTIIDITGKELMQFNNGQQSNETQIDFSGLTPGVYFVTADGTTIQKIIKK